MARSVDPGSQPNDPDGRSQELLTRSLTQLNSADNDLASKLAAFVFTGRPASAITVLNKAIKTQDIKVELDRDTTALFLGHPIDSGSATRAPTLQCDVPWDPGIYQRLGQVLAANYRKKDWIGYSHWTNRRGCHWLRGLIGLIYWRPPESDDWRAPFAVFSVERIQQMTALSGDNDGALLDILFHTTGWQYNPHPVQYLSGADNYLRSASNEIRAAADALDQTGQIRLAAAIDRLGCADSHVQWLVENACSKRNKAGAACMAALHGVSSELLQTEVARQLRLPDTEIRARAATLLGLVAGDAGRALIQQALRVEHDAKTRAAMQKSLADISLNHTRSETGDSIAAPDGSSIALPAPLARLADTPLPDHAFDPLWRAIDASNRALEPLLAARPHDSDYKYSTIEERARHRFQQRTNNSTATDIYWTGIVLHKLADLLCDEMEHEFDASGIEKFFANPALQLPQLVRIVTVLHYQDRRSRSPFAWLQHRASLPPVKRLLAELQRHGSLRQLARLWATYGNKEPLRHYLRADRDDRHGLDDLPVDDLQDYLLEQRARLDEALGLRPQSTDEVLDVAAAMEVLSLLDRVAAYYVRPLFDLAIGPRQRLRDPARRLLTATPNLDDAIADQLGNPDARVRGCAADWLRERRAAAQTDALHTAAAKEQQPATRVALLSALQELGSDTTAYFDATGLLAEAEHGLHSSKTEAPEWIEWDLLGDIRLRDHSLLDPDVIRWWITLAIELKQPGGNGLFDLYLGQLAPDDAARLGSILLHGWIEHDSAGDGSVAGPDQYRGVASRGLLALTAAVPTAVLVPLIQRYLDNYQPRAHQCRALVEVLARSDDPAALQLLQQTATGFKSRSVQALAVEKLNVIAARRGWTPEELADRIVPTAGLDPEGELALDCGSGRVYIARLGAADQVQLFNPSGTAVRGLPAARKDGTQETLQNARKALSGVKKQVKQVLAAQTGRLQQALFVERVWSVDDWQRLLLRHPIIGSLCRRLVWLLADADGRPVTTFRPLDDGSLTDAGDTAVALQPGQCVKLAHSALIDDPTRTAWLAHLDDYDVAPPFEQFRPPQPRTQGATDAVALDDRRGYLVNQRTLDVAALAAGYQRGPAGEHGVYDEYRKRFDTVGIEVVIGTSGVEQRDRDSDCALLDLQFVHLPQSGRSDSKSRRKRIPIADVPRVLLSESWNDYHRLANLGSGFDPQWRRTVSYG